MLLPSIKLPAALRPYFRYPGHIVRNVLWRFPRRPSREPHIFIMGAPRSGTTLMQVTLAAHSSIYGCQGESGLFTWQDIFDPARNHLGLGRARLDALFASCSDVVEFFDRAVAEVLAQEEAMRFVEKTPQHVRHIRFIRSHFPEGCLIHMHRDGRDALCSARRAGIPRGERVEHFARYWHACVQARQAEAGAANILDVSYERFTAHPVATMQAVMHFVGEPFEAQQVDPEMRAQDARSQEAKFAKISQRIDTKSQGRWRRELTPDEVTRFEAIAGDSLQALGYPLA